MPRRIVQKWRPPLLVVLGGTLAAVLTQPPAGLIAVRNLSPALGFRSSALLVTASVILVTAILAFLLWRLLLRPVTALAARTEALSAGDDAALAPLEHYGTTELEHLGESVLTMAATLQNREAAVRSFTDHVTHEFKSPLTAIRGAAELLELSDTGNESLRANILAATSRMEHLLAALRRIAAARAPLHRGNTTLSAILPEIARPGLTQTTSGEHVPIPLASDGLRIVLTHLIENAVEHGATQIDLHTTEHREGPRLTISDNGSGISPGNRERVFTPFFTTKREKGGTGMGLAIARTLLQAHGGSIVLGDSQKGATFIIDF
ncbi:MAG: HAMP domain-containing sensor histidine kinase [Paracoccaceae bacterium]